jgi:hypothetical protein
VTATPAPQRSLREILITDLAVACLAGIAVVHLLEVSRAAAHAPIWSAAFVGLAVAATALAVVLNRLPRRRALWAAAGGIGALPMLGYGISRAAPVPNLEAHLGQWLEPLGIAALLFEVALLGLSTWALFPATRLAPAANLVSGAVLGLVVLGSTTTFPVATGCDQRVMLTFAGQPHHDDPAAYKTQCLGDASAHEQRQAEALWRRSWRVARDRFPTFEAARRAGYSFSIKPFDGQVAGDTP